MRFKIGRRIIVIKERTIPPITKVINPPEILTPLKSWVNIKSETPLIAVLRRSVFTLKS